jgi:hypothetical protein
VECLPYLYQSVRDFPCVSLSAMNRRASKRLVMFVILVPSGPCLTRTLADVIRVSTCEFLQSESGAGVPCLPAQNKLFLGVYITSVKVRVYNSGRFRLYSLFHMDMNKIFL